MRRSRDGLTWQTMAETPGSSCVEGIVPVDDETVLVVASGVCHLVTDTSRQRVDLDLAPGQLLLAGRFVSPDHGYLLTESPRELLGTENGGLSWSRID
ncbi:hypothetical protein BH18ACT9_BH18ACT9_22740 [soil metagenome]